MEDDKIVEDGDSVNSSNPDDTESVPETDSVPDSVESSSPAPDEDDTGSDEVVEPEEDVPEMIPEETPAAEEPSTDDDGISDLVPTEEPSEDENIKESEETPEESPEETSEPEEVSNEEVIELPDGYRLIDGVLYDADGNVVDISLLSEEEPEETPEIYNDLDAFKESTMEVDLYQYMVLERLEIISYALCILIGLFFISLFIRKRK